MTTFEALFFLVFLFGILIGIALGVHLAFYCASNDQEDDNSDPYYVEPQQTPKTGPEDKGKKWSFFGKRSRSKIADRIQKKPKMSFSEFDCQFTGEEYDEKLKQAMSGQDTSYHYVGGTSK